MSIQKIKNYLGRYPRLKSFLKKLIISSPLLRSYISKKYGFLKTPYYLPDNTITTKLHSNVQDLSSRAVIIYKDLKCLKGNG